MNPTQPNYRHIIMAKTAGTCAFLAIITTLFGTMIFPYILGGLAIIFAVLSKGSTAKYQFKAKTAMLLACIALICNTAYIGFIYYNVMYNEEYRQQLDNTMEQIYGMSMEEYTNEILGIPME